jgi:hypothetical protein
MNDLALFWEQPNLVVTSFGLREIIKNRLAIGRIAKWALELMELDVAYVPQTAIKSQALADFVGEWSKTQQPPWPITQEHWSMYFDRSFTLNGVKGVVVLLREINPFTLFG